MADQIVVPIAGRLPVVTVRLRRAEHHIPRAYQALVDSGSSWTLAHAEIARAIGLSDEDLGRGRKEPFRGVGGGPDGEARGVRLHLAIGPDLDRAVVLPDGWVFFTTMRLPGGVDLLLGQEDALRRLTFAQMNHSPDPKFVLRFPSTR